MSRLSLFNSPLLLGFEQFEQAVDRVAKTADGYPPYDVEQVDQNKIRITLALAGFAANELQVQLEDNQLVIRGKKQDSRKAVYLHRGIATRQFHRSFVLAEGIEVVAASLSNGLLHIDLERPRIEPQIKKIKIDTQTGEQSAPLIDGAAQGDS